MLYTVDLVADILNVSAPTVRAAIRKGELRAVRVCERGKYLVSQEALDAYWDTTMDYFSIAEAMERIGLSRYQIKKAITTNKLSAEKVAGQYRISTDALNDFMGA